MPCLITKDPLPPSSNEAQNPCIQKSKIVVETPIATPVSLAVNASESHFDGPKKLRAALGLANTNDENTQTFDTQNKKFFDERVKDVRFLLTIGTVSNIYFQIQTSLKDNS